MAMNKQWPYFLLAFVLPILVVFWRWGAFAAAEVQTLPRAPLHYAYLVSEGDYSKAEDKQREVRELLKQQNIEGGQAITLIEDDPRTTPAAQRHAQAGIVIPDKAHPAAPLLEGNLPGRQALVVSARGHPFFVYGKAYGALLDYLRQRDMRLQLPVAETAHENTLTIEMTLK